MKTLKKIILGLAIIFIFVFTFSNTVKADELQTSEYISLVGAQIRTVDSAGIRFVSTIDLDSLRLTSEDIEVYGTLVGYGSGDATDLSVSTSLFNGKSVVNIKADALADLENKYFYGSLIGFSEELYELDLTARSYIKLTNGTYIYAQESTVKSLAEGALAAINNNITSDLIEDVKEYLEEEALSNLSFGLTYDDASYYVIGVNKETKCVVIPSEYNRKPVTNIDKSVFYGCTGLTSIVIPNSITNIDKSAFYGCTGLTSIVIPDSVTSIENDAFYGCTGLTSIKVDVNNPKYDSRNDCNCIIETSKNTIISGCKNSIIPDSVTSIGSSAFDGCTGLTSITIPDSVESIKDEAFYGCTGLTSIVIPNSVGYIGDGVFSGCNGLNSIVVDGNNEFYDSRNDCNCIIDTYSNTIISGCKNSTIPASVTSIEDYAFYNCTGLTSITIPDSVTRIGEDAFEGCTGLTSITIPDSVTRIGDVAFYGCTGLTSITIPDSVRSIGEYAFAGCTALTNVRYEGTIEMWNKIDYGAWGEDEMPVIHCSDGDIED